MANHRCVVLGKPATHLLSPIPHSMAHHSLKLDGWPYDKHEMGEDDLNAFLRGLDSVWVSLSLTIPLKKTIQPYGVPEDLWAEELRVANTVIFDWSVAADDPAQPNDKPGIELYNTDVIDIQLAFDHANREPGEHYTALRSGTALIIGNDSAATLTLAACCTIPEIGHIVVAAHHPGKNTGLKPVAKEFVNIHNPYSEIELGDDQALLEVARNATYVINTIPGHATNNVVDALADAGTELLSGLLLDVIYDPRPTKLMEAWRAHDGHAIGGEEILLHQALVQVLLMTGIQDDDPPSDAGQCLQDTTTEDDQLEIAMCKALEEAL